jgi:hypothetical protein
MVTFFDSLPMWVLVTLLLVALVFGPVSPRPGVQRLRQRLPYRAASSRPAGNRPSVLAWDG